MRSIDKDDLYKGLLFSLPMKEGAGTATVMDVAKPHHPVTQTHAPGWTQLSSGLWCLDFDGTNDYLACAAASCTDLDFTSGQFSTVLWINTDAVSGVGYLVSRGVNNASGWVFYRSTTAIGVKLNQAGSGLNTLSGAILSTGSWACVGFSRVATASVRLYYGGADTTTSPGSHSDPVSSGADLNIGCDSTLSNKFDGMLWNPRIWGRALSPHEHKQIFDRERHWFGV